MEETLIFNKLLFQLSIHALVAKLCDNAQMANFCVLYFQRAACSTFQTCILSSHKGHIMCENMVDMQSATAQNRRGKKEERRKKKKKKPRQQNVMACPLLSKVGHKRDLYLRGVNERHDTSFVAMDAKRS